MTTQLQQWLGQSGAERELDQWFASVMRSGDWDGLDAFLAEELRAHPHLVTDLALRRDSARVRLTGWDDLAAFILREEGRGSGKGPITAVGLDLSDHCEPDGDMWPLEVNLYDDGPHPFSRADVAAVNQLAADGRSPWQGDFRDIDNCMAVDGLGKLHAAITTTEQRANPASRRAGEPASVDAVAVVLGRQLMTLRFHQAIVRDAQANGLPRAMVVLGGAHDIAPFFEAAYWCDAVRAPTAAVASINAGRDAAGKARFREETEQTITDWRERRNVIIRKQLRADKQQEWIDYCASRDALFYSITGLGDGRPAHELTEREFEQLIYEYRLLRAEQVGDDPASVAVPAAPWSGFLGLFRRAS